MVFRTASMVKTIADSDDGIVKENFTKTRRELRFVLSLGSLFIPFPVSLQPS
jgi:pilus assembly protein TadC